jgi:hypothetical protein
LPLAGSRPRTLPLLITTSSGFPPGRSNSAGVLHEAATALACQASLPVALLQGHQRLALYAGVDSVYAYTPERPKKAYTALPSLTGVPEE